MARVYFLVDGFNVYHALDTNPGWHKFKWLSFTQLAACFVPKGDKLEGVEFFTTLATWDPGKIARHKLLIKANENEGVVITYGEFKRRDRRCRLCGKLFQTFEEKQTDVNIALRLFELAVQDRYDRAVIVSGDTDLLPAMKAVQRTFPSKKIGVLIPIGRASEHFKSQADFHHKMKIPHPSRGSVSRQIDSQGWEDSSGESAHLAIANSPLGSKLVALHRPRKTGSRENPSGTRINTV